LPRCARGGEDLADPHTLDSWRELAAVDGVAIAKEVPRGGLFREGLHDLLSRPTGLGSPIIVVPNDLAFLSVIAPLSLSLACRAARPVARAVAAASLTSSIVATALAHSRVATLTMVLSVSLAAAAIRRRIGIVCGLSLLGVALLSEVFLGFPLAAKFLSGKEVRIGLWAVAWTKFLEAPWLGHGPYTFVCTSADRVTTMWAHNLYLGSS
jgi:O-antigen ligase